MRRVSFLAIAAARLCRAAAAQEPSLTLEDIYGPGAGRFNGRAAPRLSFLQDPWIDNTHYLWPADESASWLKVDALTGAGEPLFDRVLFAAALRGTGAAPRRPTNFNPRHDGFLVTIGTDLFYYDIQKNILTRLTRTPSTKQNATFSPDGRSVAFVSDNNLYVTSVSAPSIRRLTADGSQDVLNGTLDWL